jgi:hypothetical protein
MRADIDRWLFVGRNRDVERVDGQPAFSGSVVDGEEPALSITAQCTLTQPFDRFVKLNIAAGVGGDAYILRNNFRRVMPVDNLRQHKAGEVYCQEEGADSPELWSGHGLNIGLLFLTCKGETTKSSANAPFFKAFEGIPPLGN